MKERETQKLYNSITNIDNKYIEEAQTAKKGKKPVWFRWGTVAACLCLVFVSVIIFPYIFKSETTSGIELIIMPDIEQSPIMDIKKFSEKQEKFIPINSLLVNENSGISETAFFQKISIEQYKGVYEKVQSVKSSVLSENRGKSVSDTEEWYYISGHTDMQYLIKNDNKEYSLWKFICFDDSEYPYSDVLEFVYQIESADAIRKIEVKPATMDNTEGGKAIQNKIGTHVITDQENISTIYQILSSMTCYGSDQWGMIDYGNVEAAADTGSSHQAVMLGRYLSIFTDYSNEIDGLKYTAVSNMFYEFSGIAYNHLSTEQAERVREILGITDSVD